MPETKNNLTDADRIMLKSVMDLIVPAVDDLPGAGEMGLGADAEKLALRVEDYGEALQRVLDALSLDPTARAEGGFAALDEEQQVAALKVLEANMPKHFDNFVDLVYIVYYSHEQVHKRIGWRSGPLQPLGWELPPFDPSILETVSKRRPFWRKVEPLQRLPTDAQGGVEAV
jgi:hypothetical protein